MSGKTVEVKVLVELRGVYVDQTIAVPEYVWNNKSVDELWGDAFEGYVAEHLDTRDINITDADMEISYATVIKREGK